MLSRADLLRVSLPQETVYIKELKDSVIVRGMTGRERDAFEASCLVGKGRKRDVNTLDMRAKLVALCCIDEKGQRLFSDEDVALLGDVRADVVDRLFSVAQRLSGLRDEDVDELGIGSANPAPTSSSSLVSATTST